MAHWIKTDVGDSCIIFSNFSNKNANNANFVFYGLQTQVYGAQFLDTFSEKVSLVSGLQHIVFVDEIPAVPKQSYTEFHHLCHLLRGVCTAALRVTLPGSDGHCVSAFMKDQDGTDSIGSSVYVCVCGGGGAKDHTPYYGPVKKV